MKKLLLFLLISFLAIDAYGQFRNYPLKLGLNFSLLDPYTEFYESRGLKFSSYSRGFLRFELGQKFEAEIGGGYVHYAGLDKLHNYYSTNVFPFDGRVIYSPFEFESFNPYAFAGLGIIYAHVTERPAMVSPISVSSGGYSAIIPLGIGSEFKITNDLFFNLCLGYTQSFISYLNFYQENENGISSQDGFFNLGAGFTLVLDLASKDSDNDKLFNSEEEQLGTDPKNPDTDGDGLKDGDEVQKYHTNPLKADTDNDGLSDAGELNKYSTDPNKNDTDNDGLNDGEEVLKYNTDPLKNDTDGDKLLDGAEVTQYHTSPLKIDTDGDGLQDGEEVLSFKTDPLNADTDGDGLLDGEEVLKYKTDPLKADTDAGTVSDGAEVKAGTDPLNANDDVAKKPEPAETTPVKPAAIEEEISLQGIVFGTSKANITPAALQILNKDLDILLKHKNVKFEVQGHTDSQGSRQSNITLSEKRAKNIMKWFSDRGVDASRMSVKGFGPDKPAASNETPEGRQTNRRIELEVKK